ncbi:MAG: YeeE/YedE thiosulfate transporter family protein [Bacillota bacterium]
MGFSLARWSPYLVGIFIGVLSWLSFLISDKPLGASTAFARTSGMIEKLIKGEEVLEKEYYKKVEPVIDWGWMLVLGIVIGSFISSILSGQFQFQFLPEFWVAEFGQTPLLRLIVALVGGFFMGFGARWAGGCTSGHGISGTLQLAISSWIAAICFFIGGIFTALLLY